ncbi:MAG: hypothetical protein FJ316_02115 [SAR202 cluster bacterium]|nr:hypothetical protein [SAR202 cluster bacterium]
MTKFKGSIGAVVLALALALASAAAGMGVLYAQTPSPGTISISPQAGTAGTVVTVTGTGFTVGETGISITYDGTAVLTNITATSGTFTQNYTIPSSTTTTHTFSGTRTSGTVNSVTFELLKPFISLSSSSGPPGASITVTGSNFRANETGISVTYDGATMVSGLNAGSNGGWSATFNAPSSLVGPHTIAASGSQTLASTVPSLTFTVSAGISASKNSGPVGTPVSVSGAGFAVNETGVNITFDGVNIASTTANAQGTWTANFTVPATASGNHTIGAFGRTTLATSVGTVAFTVQPAIALNKSTGAPGTSVTITGTGFAVSDTNINVTFGSTTVLSNLRADSKGGWSANFSVPTTSAGTHTVSAFGNGTPASSISDQSFTIGAGITLSRPSGPPGSSITVTGTGFGANESGIVITYDGTPVASGIAANSVGAWTGSFSVPVSAAGSHVVRAFGGVGGGGSSGDASFTASPTITLSKSSGAPGTSITVNGAGFGANERSISLTFDGVQIASGINANAQGSWVTTINIPGSGSGAHTIAATGSSSSQSTGVDAPFTVGSGLTLSRSSGPPGTAITVGGAGYAPNERNINLTYDGVQVASGITANAQGAWTYNFTVPPSPTGSHTIAAGGASSQGAPPDTVYSVTPALSLNRTSGPPGTSIAVTGAGFGASERGITITFEGTPVASGINANAQGSWTQNVVAPPSPAGARALSASGPITQTFGNSDVTFIVAAELTVNRHTGAPGTPITVGGAGFASGEGSITLTFDGTPVASGITANAQGGWSATFAIPAAAAGPHEIKASGSATQGASAPDFRFAVVPVVSISPNTGNVGMRTEVTGSGFSPNASLAITFGEEQIRGGAVTANGAGSFSFAVVIPRARAGAQALKIVDGDRNEAQVSFTIEGVPPRMPGPLTPKNNERMGLLGNISPTLTWSNLHDPSGVTYALQIDANPSFSRPILEKFDLTSPSYTLAPGEALPRGRYYWRVRSVDGAYNESSWSEPIVLRSGLMPLWALIGLVLVALAAVGGAGVFGYLYFFRRKTEVIRVGEVAVPTPVPGYFRELSAPEEAAKPQQQRALGLPSRLALPGATSSRRPRVLSPQEQGRLKILAEFAKSLPLIQVGYDADWLQEVASSANGEGSPEAVREQLLAGNISLNYEPSWQSHPLYLELRSVLDGHPLLQGLDNYIESVNRCASDVAGMLQEIYRETSGIVSDEAMRRGRWQYVYAVYADALGWFRGKFLREPSERDYYMLADGQEPAQEEGNVMWLRGADATPFAGELVTAPDQAGLQESLELHIRLRRNYRKNERAKSLVETLAQLEVQRDRLLGALGQLGQMGG